METGCPSVRLHPTHSVCHAVSAVILCGRALVQSQVDTGLRDEAVKTSHSAIQLARKKVPGKLPDVLKLHMLYGLGEGKSVEKEMKSFPEISIFARLYKLKQ